MSTKKRSRLARRILGLIGASGIISIFFNRFLVFMTQAIVEIYCEKNRIVMTDLQYELTQYWLQRVSLITAVILFLLLCFFLTGQKLLYIRYIIQGVEALRENDMNFEVPIEGEDELAQLAESINYLAKSQRDLKEKEIALKEEKDAFIRTLSHDIRTPLTSVLAMSEYVEQKDNLTAEEVKNYISLVKNKSAQMKVLTDRLLNEGQRKQVFVENGKLLFEQLLEEWSELLENDYECRIEMEECPQFSGEFDIAELRRIFDNLASNIEKYADTSKEIKLQVSVENDYVVIRQSNYVAGKLTDFVDSYGIGLQSIERLAKIYSGMMEIEKDETRFTITIKLHL